MAVSDVRDAPPAVRDRPVGRRERRPALFLAWGSWAAVGALALVALMRIVAWDILEPFAVLNTVTAFVYLPALLVVPIALVLRRPFLVAAGMAIVLAQVVFLLPELTAAQPVPAWAVKAPTFRLLDANVFDGNPSMAGYGKEIDTVRPDLLTMEEANLGDVAQLERSAGLQTLPYRFEVDRDDPWAFFLASRYPLQGTHVVSIDQRPLVVQTTVRLPSGLLSLWVVHTIAPLPSSFASWQGQFTALERLLRTRGPTHLLVVGDFNATWGNRGFRNLLGAGMTDAAAARGNAFEMTWSQTMGPLPTLVRIDHVLTGSGLAVTRITTEPGPGSDHRALVATVAVRHG